jgi:hypothetical protein
MVDISVNLYVTKKEESNHGYDGARLVESAIQEAAAHQNLTTDVDIIYSPQDVGGENAGCGGSPWSTWRSRVNNNNIPSKDRSNLLITNRGYYDDFNGDGCAVVHGKASMVEGGKEFANVSGISDVPRLGGEDPSDNLTHHYLSIALMEIGHNYGGIHDTENDNHHGNDYRNSNGKTFWTPIVHGYHGLKGTENVCGNDTLESQDGYDRYYGDCMAGEF